MSATRSAEQVLAWSLDFQMNWHGVDDGPTGIIYKSVGLESDWATENIYDGHCHARYVQNTCELRPTIMEWSNVSVANTSSAGNAGVQLPVTGFVFSNGQFAEGLAVTSYSDISEDGTGPLSTIGGIQFALNDAYATSAVMSFNASSGWRVENRRMPRQTGTAQSFWVPDHALEQAFRTCFFEIYDPLADIMLALNQWTYLLSISALPSPNDPYHWQWPEPLQYGPASVLATRQGYGVQYITNKSYMVSAAVSMLSCALLILPSYYGFWHLGRDVTLSPLEISHAFGAPILESTSVDGGMQSMKREFGGIGVQYGVVGRETRLRLGIARPGVVQNLHVH